MVKFLGIGDNTIDIYYDQGIQFPGGNAVNVTVLSSKLGANASYLGCISTDFFGNIIKDALIAEGIEISHSRFCDEPNSWSRIRHIEGDRSFDGSYENEKIDYGLTCKDYDYISKFDIVHTSVYSFLEDDLNKISGSAKLLSFDFSDCNDAKYIGQISGLIDIAFISDPTSNDEECRLRAQMIKEQGPSMVVVTRGKNGVLAYDGNQFYNQDIVETTVVDTLGAGDGFIAAFLSSWVISKEIGAALFRGVVYAAKVCTYKGGFGYGTEIQESQPGLV